MATVRRDVAAVQSLLGGQAALTPQAKGAKLTIQELEGSYRIKITLQGSFGIEIGAEWASELRGETRVPLGSRDGYSSASGITWGKTEMMLSLDAAFLRRKDLTVENASPPFSPEDVDTLFRQLQGRARECLVSIGTFVRRGVLRGVAAVPNRGHSVDFGTGQRTALGLNLALKLTWDWAGAGALPSLQEPPASPGDIAGQLGSADGLYGTGLASAQELFAPDAFTALSDGINSVRSAISDMRSAVKQIGSIVSAPAKLINQALDAARSLGNVLNDVDNMLSDTREAYLALGPAADSVATALGPRPSDLARVNNAKADLRAANQAAMAALVALFDGVAQRKARRVAVVAGQSLADIAQRELGSADRWTEIADRNALDGQVVPAGITEVELPAEG